MTTGTATANAKFAALQMISGDSLTDNLATAGRLIADAAAAGAQLVALPENFYLISLDENAKVALREREGDGAIQRFLADAARRNRVWIVGGTAPLASDDPRRIRSACLVFDDAGRQVARYDKMHLFRFSTTGESYDEARTLEAGTRPQAVETPFGRLALSVCYDIRFPELYRSLGAFDALFLPSAFTVPTGRAHWETLLRARAIENLAYVVAPAQGGRHPNGRNTYGHTLIVDPWGEIVAERAEGEGIVMATIDHRRIADVRRSLPALENRRLRPD
jgi:predicted amidohydrolase